jgi:hydrogenase maturation protease
VTDDGVNVVIGVGNRLRSDDAVGPVVVDRLQGRLPDAVHLVESLGDPVSLLGWWQSASLAVVVDAVKTGTKPGTVFQFKGDHPLPSKFFRQSTHLVGLADALEMARTLGRLPKSLVLFGIEVESMEPGEHLSDPVASAVHGVVEAIVALFDSPGVQEVAEGAKGA